MHFSYTRHIRKRIRQRGISWHQIEETAREPDWTGPGYGGKELAVKGFRGRFLTVVFKREAGAIVLVTTYWKESVR